MAEAILRAMLTRDGIRKVKASSAGVAAIDGLPASMQAVTVCREHGLDIRRHRSRLLTPTLASKAGLVLTMTGSQWYEVTDVVPREDAFVLGRFGRSDDEGGDVRDPFGSSVERYRETFSEIRGEIERAYADILTHVGADTSQ